MKKIFLSLSAIALLAVGTVSCGSDDSSEPGPGPGPGPEPGPELTENFISVDGEQYETDFSRWFVRTLGNTAEAPIVEYPKSETDPTLVSVYDLVTWTLEDGKLVNFIYTVDVDESKPVGSDDRIYYPFTENPGVFTPETELIAAYYVEGTQSFAFNPVPTVAITAMSYQNKTLAYTTSGNAQGKSIEVNFDGEGQSMYIMDVSDDAATTSTSVKSLELDKVENSRITKSLKK